MDFAGMSSLTATINTVDAQRGRLITFECAARALLPRRLTDGPYRIYDRGRPR